MVEAIVCRNIQNRQEKKKNRKSKRNEPNPADTEIIFQDKKQKKRKRAGTKKKRRKKMSKLHGTTPRTHQAGIACPPPTPFSP